MPRGHCRRHNQDQPCTCAMGNLYRFVEPLALFLLRIRGESYGYELVTSIREQALTDSVIEPGALYRTLRNLEENGHVSSSWDVTRTGPARRLYRLTPSGVKHLEEWADVMDNLSRAMVRFVEDVRALPEEGTSPSPEKETEIIEANS